MANPKSSFLGPNVIAVIDRQRPDGRIAPLGETTSPSAGIAFASFLVMHTRIVIFLLRNEG